MLALIAATSFETRLLRTRLQKSDPLPGRFPLFHGQLDGQEILLTHSGVGKANAAACTAILLSHRKPRALLNLGCAGAYPDCGLRIGDLALADGDILADEGSDSPAGFLGMEELGLPLLRRPEGDLFNRMPTDPELFRNAESLLRAWASEQDIGFATGPFASVSTCTGTDQQGRQRQQGGAICENMEGAAIALTAARFGCPLLELRGISNLAARRDPDQWDIPAACRNAERAILHLLRHWPRS
ncbi:futalosine hydrolase [Geothermobacter hydrogeniphilus]|uniref:Futalosine hydrolase n=1 Tax=Geothermobacter hydrogeniphilus TaxID=1969733 RepID=A0A1X0YA29_9BACT|nr:futalosine hydrolase [Geothermobacter hydrogeniphilus]ORJ62051.1 futalosine hydrolase [Geothermobacter hydrogeniphilus]